MFVAMFVAIVKPRDCATILRIMFENIRIVLINTSHPGNIGSAARAMKTMGIHNLYLVSPVKSFPNATAIELAAGADDILVDAVVCQTMEEALVGCKLVVGTSARNREIPLDLLNPRETGEMVYQYARDGATVAIVFGREHAGLTNEELLLCHRHVMIPANPYYSSLNLAQAVQVLCYEVKMASFFDKQESLRDGIYDDIPTHDELEKFYEHMLSALRAVGFLKPNAERKLPNRLRRLFTRANLEQYEVSILRGVLTAMQNMAAKLHGKEIEHSNAQNEDRDAF